MRRQRAGCHILRSLVGAATSAVGARVRGRPHGVFGGTRVAETALAAGGPTVTAFPSPAALVNGIGMPPQNHESAGQRLSSRTIPEPGLPRDPCRRDRRMVRTKGKQRAAVLGTHTLAVDIGYLLARETPYVDQGVDAWDRREQDRVRRHAVKCVESLGYQVTLTPASIHSVRARMCGTG